MQCEVCGWDDFVEAEYVSEHGRAPALECTRCYALNLTEDAARTSGEHDSIKLAIAVRDTICERDSVLP